MIYLNACGLRVLGVNYKVWSLLYNQLVHYVLCHKNLVYVFILEKCGISSLQGVGHTI